MKRQNTTWKSEHNVFQTGIVKTRCYLTSKKTPIYSELMYFLHVYVISENYLGSLGSFRHVLADTTTGRCSYKKAAPKI